MNKVVITGATGRLGQAAIAALVPAHELTAIVRQVGDARLPVGVTQIAAPLADVAGLTRAFEGAQQCIAILPDHPDLPTMMAAVTAAAQAAGLKRIVKISAHLASETPPRSFGIEHAHADEVLRGSGIEAVVLRPAMFMQSLSLFLADMAKGRIMVPVRSGHVALIDAADIAAAAAKAAAGDVAPGTYMLTGPQSLSFGDVAAQLAAWSGLPLKHVAPPLWLASLLMRFDTSLDAFNRARLIDLLGALEEGREAPVFPDLERILGRRGRTLGELLAAMPAYDSTVPTFRPKG